MWMFLNSFALLGMATVYLFRAVLYFHLEYYMYMTDIIFGTLYFDLVVYSAFTLEAIDFITFSNEIAIYWAVRL